MSELTRLRRLSQDDLAVAAQLLAGGMSFSKVAEQFGVSRQTLHRHFPKKAVHCSIDGCGRPHGSRGLCDAHYRRWQKTGVRGGDIAPHHEDLHTRFFDKVDKAGPIPVGNPGLGPCWIWRGSVSGGYGRISANRKTEQAHRVSFELAGGVVPSGMVLDHLCQRMTCVNPSHLEPVTNSENVRRTYERGAR